MTSSWRKSGRKKEELIKVKGQMSNQIQSSNIKNFWILQLGIHLAFGL
jgi:hypothetical protein